MVNHKGIGTAIVYSSVNPSFLNNKKVLQLSSVQFHIVLYTIVSLDYCASKRTGIYNISTSQFPRNLSIDDIQDQLGRTDLEISLKLRNAIAPVSPEERDHFKGNINKYFPNILEYDPETDMVFSKLAFAYSGITYLNSGAKVIEGIHAEYKQTKNVVPQRWWGEFMSINSRHIREAWEEVITPKPKKKEVKYTVKNNEPEILEREIEETVHKNFNSLKKTFDHLFELEKQYNIFERKIAPEKLKKMKDFLESDKV